MQAKRKQQQRMMYRQGDVLVVAVEEIPAGAKEVPREDGRVVLAHGEVTGHAHAILAPQAQLYAMEDTGSGGAPPRRYLGLSTPAELQHEEHSTIALPAGKYEVVRQREYHPEELRQVAD